MRSKLATAEKPSNAWTTDRFIDWMPNMADRASANSDAEG
jgi:hypothetical protein